MAPVFSKNAILVGTVSYFCLVCETHLKSERDTDVHISKPVHQKQLEAIPYVDEFKAEGIKKIKNQYFCELCNKVLAVPARVRLHVAEQSHADTKYKNSFKRVGNYLTALGKIAICDQSWNALSENSCAICNTEFEDQDIHKNQSTHILNIVQIQVEIDNDQNVYRKIDDLHCQCLTCNTVLALNSLTSHFVGDKHKTLYQACCDAYNNITLEPQPDKLIKDETIKSETIKTEVTKNDPESIGNDNINYTKASRPRVNKKNRNTNKVIKENDQKDTQPDKTIKDETTKSETLKKKATKNDPESIVIDIINYTEASTPRVNYQNRIINKVIKEKVQKAILNLSKTYLQQMETNTTSSNEKEHAQKYANMVLEDPDKFVDKISGTCEKSILASKESGSKPNKFRSKVMKKTAIYSTPLLITCNNEESNEDDTSNTEIVVEIYENI